MLFCWGLAVNAAVGILQLAGIIAPKQGWFSGLARGYNTLTVYLVLAILICAFCIRDSEGWKKRFLFIALASLYFFHLIIMEGRTGYLTFILLFPFMVKTLFRRFSAWKFALVFTVIVGAMYFSPFVKKRVDVTITQLRYHMTADPDKAWGREYTENQDRFYMWVGAIEVFLENPLIGAGTGGYPSALKEIRPPGRSGGSSSSQQHLTHGGELRIDRRPCLPLAFWGDGKEWVEVKRFIGRSCCAVHSPCPFYKRAVQHDCC
jgi:O-antigen ligase